MPTCIYVGCWAEVFVVAAREAKVDAICAQQQPDLGVMSMHDDLLPSAASLETPGQALQQEPNAR
jgi:hypothetical protein